MHGICMIMHDKHGIYHFMQIEVHVTSTRVLNQILLLVFLKNSQNWFQFVSCDILIGWMA